jgi:hypothetical protein
MSGSKSKNKGNSWERTVAKFLSDLYSAPFIRTPHSGAFIGGMNSIRKQSLSESQIKNFKGDIIPPETWKKFNCEAKSYADFPFHQLYQTNVPILEKWIEQVLEVADEGDFNVIIMKFNRKGSYVATQLTPSLIPNSNFFTYKSLNHGVWLIQDFESFWTANSDHIKTLCE